MQLITRRIAAQLGLPSGWFGRQVMTRLLNRGNQELLTAVVGALALKPGEDVLDIGFGGGLLLQMMAERAGAVYGVDRSPDAVAGARRLLADRAELQQGEVTALPLPTGSVDVVTSVNTVYFWPELGPPLAEIRRVLRPGGRVLLGFSSGEKLHRYGSVTEHGFARRAPDVVAAAVDNAGFVAVETLALAGRRTRGDFLVMGTRG